MGLYKSFFLGLLWISTALTGSLQATDIPFFQGNFSQVKQKAQQEKKLVMIEFYTDRCGICIKMERQTFSDPGLIRHISGQYIPFRLDGQSFVDEGVELAKRYKVRAYPTIVIVDAQGELIKTLEGYFTARVLQAELTNPHVQSTKALFASVKPGEGPSGKVLKTVRPQKSQTKASGKALAIFFSAYVLDVFEFDSYGDAQDAVRVWDVPWQGEIWIIPVGQGRHKVVLGPLDNKKEAEAAKIRMLREHNLYTQILDLGDLM